MTLFFVLEFQTLNFLVFKNFVEDFHHITGIFICFCRPRSHPNFSCRNPETSYFQTDYNATMMEVCILCDPLDIYFSFVEQLQ